MLLVNEIFESIKGEGVWLGVPMTFVRLAHCNLTCDNCDTNFNSPSISMSEGTIVNKIPPRIDPVVMTGGEPSLQEIGTLIMLLQSKNHVVHVESNGTRPLRHFGFNWVCVSPKLRYGTPCEDALQVADEIKMPISSLIDIEVAERFRAVNTPMMKEDVVWYLHPWNDLFECNKVGSEMDEKGARTLAGFNPTANKICVQHAIATGRWRVSIQAHKLLEVR